MVFWMRDLADIALLDSLFARRIASVRSIT
jgi:hypothetical protein